MNKLLKSIVLFSIVCTGFLSARETIRSEDSARIDDYKLYDRNAAGLDFNPYSFPGSNPQVER